MGCGGHFGPQAEFSGWNAEHIIFCTQFSAQNAGNRILGNWNFEIFKGCTPRPQTPLEKGK